MNLLYWPEDDFFFFFFFFTVAIQFKSDLLPYLQIHDF